jgi:hypothetical protein
MEKLIRRTFESRRGKKIIARLSIQQLTANRFALISDEAVSSALLAFLSALMFDGHTSQR